MKKAMNLIMVVVILASMAIPIVAGATASNPYRHKDAWFQSYSQGCAAIYRCSCNKSAVQCKRHLQVDFYYN